MTAHALKIGSKWSTFIAFSLNNAHHIIKETMAKDILGLLNGLGKVATAFSHEIGVELSTLSRKASGNLAPCIEQDSTTNHSSSEVNAIEESSLAEEFEELTKSQQFTGGAPRGTRSYHTWSRLRGLHGSKITWRNKTTESESQRHKRRQKVHCCSIYRLCSNYKTSVRTLFHMKLHIYISRKQIIFFLSLLYCYNTSRLVMVLGKGLCLRRD